MFLKLLKRCRQRFLTTIFKMYSILRHDDNGNVNINLISVYTLQKS